MKFVSILLLLNSLFLCYGLLKKSQNKATVAMNNQNKILESYARSIFRELNEYRRDNGFGPRIKWMPDLVTTTTQEAQNIADSSSFGQHSKFHKWKQAISNRYFTELSVLVDSRQDGAPSPRVFGLSVLYALEQKEKFYLIHSYTQGAVSVIQNPKKKFQYIAVIHLLKKQKTVNSCMEAKNFGLKTKFVNILINGKKQKFECENEEQGGGWTLIHEMDKKMARSSTTKINDYGFKYSEIYFKSSPDHYSSQGYCTNFKITNNAYTSHGFNFALDWLQFGDTWYMSNESPWGHPNSGHQKVGYYPIANIQKIGEPEKVCSWVGKNHPQYCVRSFIMKKKPAGRLAGISQSESFNPRGNNDDCYHYHFKLYVR